MSVKTVQATLNGQTYNLTLNSSLGRYEATITAPTRSSYTINSEHYYAVSIRAEDTAGNVTTKTDADSILGSSLKLVVKEKTAPLITITSPTASALTTNNRPVIAFTVMDDDSGVNPDTIKITIDSTITTAGITKTAVTGGYRCSYTPTVALIDGAHTIKVDAIDFDENAAMQKSVSFTIDTVPPVLNVTHPSNYFVTNQASCTVEGSTNDVTSSPCTVTIKHNSNAAVNVVMDSNGAFRKAFTMIEGQNTFVIRSTDGATKYTEITRIVTLDTIAPVVSNVTLIPNPVDAGKTFVLSVFVTD